MLRQGLLVGVLVILTLVSFSPAWARDALHYFSCEECHRTGATLSELGGNNVCLRCHHVTSNDITLNPGAPPMLDGHTDGRFTSQDASDIFGHGSGIPGADQTSHTWATPSDTLAAAGAQAPTRSEHPEFYSRYGTSSGKLTCSRCHNPHDNVTTNPKLLVKGQNSADEMCQACHQPWVRSERGWLTHPIIEDYNASVTANPDRYNATLNNKGFAGIKLVGGGVSCTSCHGMHFTDSDSSTVDGPTENLSISDGKLLLGDGPERADKSSLCKTCHTYMEHGNNSGEKVGCLVCHSGHSYDPAYPNYFVLRKSAVTAAYGTVAGLDYSSPDVLNAGLKYTFWNDGTDGTANGYCEKCHGDAEALPGSFHSSAAVCTDCHKHDAGSSGSFGHGGGTGGEDCSACHMDAHNVDKTQAAWITFFAVGSDHTWDAGYKVDTYATCTMCHATNLLPIHSENCALCHFGSSPPRESFTDWNQGCQQGSCHASYHPNASPGHDNEYNLINCLACHDSTGRAGWYNDYAWDKIARADFCVECHTLPSDTNPPVSESDLLPNYIDDAIIILSAFDPWGIQAIYYQIDGGATQTYTGPITVTAPVSSTQAHTLAFWARDKSGNNEAAQSENFTISQDTIPPVTTSDARAYYGADATIHLTATDDATSMPVAATYYVFDDTGATPVEGTTAVFPEVASGTEAHTLYYWSVDHAGNVEAQNSVDFTMVANGLEHTGTTTKTWATGYSEPYSGAERALADPWVSYQIYIDGAPIGGPLTKVYNTYISSYNGQLYPTMPQTWATTWSCPPGTTVSPGSRIDLVVNAGFSDRALWTGDSEFPAKYSFILPAGTVQLEPANWSISLVLDWKAFDYFMAWDPYEGHSSISIQPSVENIAYVTTAADTTSPVTQNNAVSGKTYGSAQTFTLTPQDEVGGTGVESTWWQLDSTSGSWTKGTSVSVPTPATVASTKAHTLYWYSQDHAGNQESIKSVSFSIENLRTFTTTLSLDQVVWYEAIPDDASGAWVKYTIKLDGTTLGSSFYATQAGTYNKTFNHLVTEANITGTGQIDIIVTAGLTTPGSWENNTNSPQTFTLTLPAESTRLLYKGWTGFPNYNWTPHTYYYDSGPPIVEYPYSYLELPTGTIGNIGYQSAGSDTDMTPPITTIDAVDATTYSGDHTFTLTSTDADAGVESTWWQLDGNGVWNIGTSIPVVAPVSGTVPHTITWYSRDNVANQEAQQSVTFDVLP